MPGDCAIRVGDQTYEWKEGDVTVFDDMEEHEAWNKSHETRVVLIVDILKSAYEICPPKNLGHFFIDCFDFIDFSGEGQFLPLLTSVFTQLLAVVCLVA